MTAMTFTPADPEAGPRMNPEVKALWTAALRSGEFEQGTGVLNDGNGHYCCLGVLCELAIRAGVNVPVGRGRDAGAVTYDDNTALPPRAVAEWAGLLGHNYNPVVEDDGLTYSLAEFNDGNIPGGVSRPFDRIADLIDAQL